jgi:hypothetical protein
MGTLGLVGLSLDQLLHAQAAGPIATRTKRAKACILFFLEGGPSHIDLWDMKPDAPAQVRGEFAPIATSAPTVHLCEHLPLLAQQMRHVAQVRSVYHKIVDHNAGSYYMLTGHSPTVGNRLIVGDEPTNFPPYGAVSAHLQPVTKPLPAFVHLPDIMSNNGYDLPGQRAGFLGAKNDPFVAGDPSAPGYRIPGLSVPDDLPLGRVGDRRALLEQIDRRLDARIASVEVKDVDQHYRRAFELLSSTATRRAFDLTQEPESVRERYGLPDRIDRSRGAREFGGLPHLGQCMLLARRLIEAGVRLVTVGTGRRYDQSWDTHRKHFPLLKRSLLPYADRAFSALLDDLSARGMLEETLVIAMGEFGRTPKLGQITSGAGADAGGRDHWPHCYTVLFAGGGVRGGTVYGASDPMGAYPRENAVTPEDIAATIYFALGFDLQTRVFDPQLGIARPLAEGRPIVELFT